MDVAEELESIVGALRAAGLDYALCGGLAVAVHGAPRATKDVDLLVQESDLPAILAAVAAVGYRHLAAPMRFPDGMRLQRVSRIDGGELMTLDLLLVNEHTQAAWDSRATYSTAGGEIRVVGRDALIAMKVWSGRPQDAYDITRLQGNDR